jgi:hypothetical protein
MGKSPMDQPTTRHICLSGCPQAGEMAHWVTADPFRLKTLYPCVVILPGRDSSPDFDSFD